MGIPKIIMQTWKNENIPDKWSESPLSIRKHMPDWKYVLMTDDDNRRFVAEHFPDFLDTYDSFEYPIQRADAIRACWLYVNGGVYMDLDFVIKRPLDDLFESDCQAYFVSSGNISSSKTNSFMASKPGCMIWIEYIEEMKKKAPNWAFGKHFKVMSTTGPMALTRVLNKTSSVYGNLPASLVMPCSVCQINNGQIHVPDDAYLSPLVGGSWNDWTSNIANITMCKWRTITFVCLVIILFFIVLFAVKLSKSKQ